MTRRRFKDMTPQEQFLTGVRLYFEAGPESEELGERVVYILTSALFLTIALVLIPLNLLVRGPRT